MRHILDSQLKIYCHCLSIVLFYFFELDYGYFELIHVYLFRYIVESSRCVRHLIKYILITCHYLHDLAQSMVILIYTVCRVTCNNK